MNEYSHQNSSGAFEASILGAVENPQLTQLLAEKRSLQAQLDSGDESVDRAFLSGKIDNITGQIDKILSPR